MSGKNRKLTRSIRLHKYEAIYTDYMKKENMKEVKKEDKEDKEDKKETKKSSLNIYQKFVKEESKKDKYRNMRGSERLSAIASAWEIKKRELKKYK